MSVVLYSYFRSSASWRVRIALNWKGIAYEYVPVSLLKDEHRTDDYRSRNPLAAVPLLEIDGHRLAESAAIIEYLEETRPLPHLLPSPPLDRALARRIAETFNAGTQPIQNLRVLRRLESQFGADAEAKKSWASHFISETFRGVEELLESSAGTCCVGDQVTVADVFLVPQLYGARRFGVDVAQFPYIARIEKHLATLPAFEKAQPSSQPDCPPGER